MDSAQIRMKSSKLAENPFIRPVRNLTVPRRFPLLSLLLVLSLCSFAPRAAAQALIPHTLPLKAEELKQQGLLLAQEAAQLGQFRQYQLALPRAELAAQLLPNDHRVWLLLGRLYLQTGELDSGVTALQQAQSLDSENASVLFALGSAYFQQEDYQAAIEHLQAGLQLAPEDLGALFDLGNAYYKLDRYEEAITQYETAIQLDPEFWPAINNIGLVKYELGDTEEAIEQWEAAAAVDEEAAEPRLAIAVAVYAQGDRERGLSLGERAIQLDGRYADLEFLKENLWGEQLLTATRAFLDTPRMQAVIAQVEEEALN